MCGNSKEINLQCESEVRGGGETGGWSNKDGSWDSQLIHNCFVQLSVPGRGTGRPGTGEVNLVGQRQGLKCGPGRRPGSPTPALLAPSKLLCPFLHPLPHCWTEASNDPLDKGLVPVPAHSPRPPGKGEKAGMQDACVQSREVQQSTRIGAQHCNTGCFLRVWNTFAVSKFQHLAGTRRSAEPGRPASWDLRGGKRWKAGQRSSNPALSWPNFQRKGLLA